MVCGRQNIPLRGHRETGKVLEGGKEGNDGCFRALLRDRVDAGDKTLKNHLSSCASNAKYTSPDTQNEIIIECGKLIKVICHLKNIKLPNLGFHLDNYCGKCQSRGFFLNFG